jgi:hypothetical protein
MFDAKAGVDPRKHEMTPIRGLVCDLRVMLVDRPWFSAACKRHSLGIPFRKEILSTRLSESSPNALVPSISHEPQQEEK